jgi:hypothetical protein
MRRSLRPAFLVAALLIATVPVAASSFLQGGIQGIELCPKEICTVAVFVGAFDGEVDGRSRHGVFLAGIDHELPLPVLTNDTADITGGAFVIRIPFRTPIRGGVLGGTLTKNEDETFVVVMSLLVESASGPVPATFTGTLSHELFPPTIEGDIETID